MTKIYELSPKMLEVLAHMRKHNGKLHRFPGGYWAAEGWHMYHGPCYGTSTIEALVRRGQAEYTVWADGRGGKFPIEVTLTCGDEGDDMEAEQRGIR